MDVRLFNTLTCVVSTVGPRRYLLGKMEALPVLGGIVVRDIVNETDAKDRRRRRKRRHNRRRDRGAKGRSGCQRKCKAAICAGLCGTVESRKSCDKPVVRRTSCPDSTTVCCEGRCQTQAELDAACPSTNTPGFLTFSEGEIRCASQQAEACTCLGGVFRACAPGTVCKTLGPGILCDWPR